LQKATKAMTNPSWCDNITDKLDASSNAV